MHNYWTVEDIRQARRLNLIETEYDAEAQEYFATAQEYLGTNVPNGITLEVGCGYGRLLQILYRKAISDHKNVLFFGTDSNPAMLDLAIKQTYELPIMYRLTTDGFGIGQIVHFVFSYGVMQHNSIENVTRSFRASWRVMHPGSKMCHDCLDGDSLDAQASVRHLNGQGVPLFAHRGADIIQAAEAASFRFTGVPVSNNRRKLYEFERLA